ncbi:Carboxylic ester hydrolase [Mycena venus]|uniref:Carboxylic ester hydrolase n=1 Tax=Mycena venus TaxID=2733690 RepID=A0A8H6XZQ3_9AGAR|nr:Carboxylic ester hydrolase [Mycena venus]
METAGVPTYGYVFTQSQPSSPPAFGGMSSSPIVSYFPLRLVLLHFISVFHGSEIGFVYGTVNDSETFASALRLSTMMIDY